jgi:ATP-dependent DNA helicase RecG
MADIPEDVLKKPVSFLKGIGEARAKLFNKIGVYSIVDIIKYYPRGYEDRSNIVNIDRLKNGESCSIKGTIMARVKESRYKGRLTIQKVDITDSTGMIRGVWFNQSYLKNVLKLGESYVFYGKIKRKGNYIEMQNPVYEKVNEAEMKNTCRIIPVYSSTAKLTQSIIRTAVNDAIKLVEGRLEETLPLYIREKYQLCEINYSVLNIHFPSNSKAFNISRYRLVFEELFFLQLGLLSIKQCFKKGKKGIYFSAGKEVQEFINSLPFELTKAQLRVLKEIGKDMESNKVMNRLVQGDVGSGKTIVAIAALFKAVKSGYQGTLMAPTEILAEQHYRTICDFLHQYGVKIGLLTGSISGVKKDLILKEIKEGQIDIIIGTHALIQDNVEFLNLGIVVTDEQHRFGVRQRAALSQKGENPDILVMTATPIPRTLALVLYGDLDISIIDEVPPGRKPVKTYAVDNRMRERINNFICKNVNNGRQVYIICPLIEDSDVIEAKSTITLAENIAKNDFKGFRVGVLHGRMNGEQKENIMRSFVENNIDILVSTTVVEVGVDVPNANIIVIENAERFGLSQLHQLRGRVGRGEHQSYCILYNESESEVSRQRMKVMQETCDGFIISEKDLELRGPGDFFGTRQHGMPDLKIANLFKDMEILKLAQKEAINILKEDEDLQRPENSKLKDIVTSMKEEFSKVYGNL